MRKERIELEIYGDEIRMLYDGTLDLAKLGKQKISRASHVEFNNETGKWYVQSARTLKMIREDFDSRSKALAFEKEYYNPGGLGWDELTEGI